MYRPDGTADEGLVDAGVLLAVPEADEQDDEGLALARLGHADMQLLLK